MWFGWDEPCFRAAVECRWGTWQLFDHGLETYCIKLELESGASTGVLSQRGSLEGPDAS